jgi:DNA-binding Xre family transcriptional regulator
MKLILKEYLQKNNISVYWLEKETKISHKTLYDMVNRKTKAITYINLGKICKALKCLPTDLFESTF